MGIQHWSFTAPALVVGSAGAAWIEGTSGRVRSGGLKLHVSYKILTALARYSNVTAEENPDGIYTPLASSSRGSEMMTVLSTLKRMQANLVYTCQKPDTTIVRAPAAVRYLTSPRPRGDRSAGAANLAVVNDMIQPH